MVIWWVDLSGDRLPVEGCKGKVLDSLGNPWYILLGVIRISGESRIISIMRHFETVKCGFPALLRLIRGVWAYTLSICPRVTEWQCLPGRGAGLLSRRGAAGVHVQGRRFLFGRDAPGAGKTGVRLVYMYIYILHTLERRTIKHCILIT